MERITIVIIAIGITAAIQGAYALGLNRGMERADEWQALREVCEERLDDFRGCEAVRTFRSDGGVSRAVACMSADPDELR